jgi:hypothetical protein
MLWLFTGIHHLCTGYSTGVEGYQHLINMKRYQAHK